MTEFHSVFQLAVRLWIVYIRQLSTEITRLVDYKSKLSVGGKKEFYVTDVIHPTLFPRVQEKSCYYRLSIRVSCVAFYLRITLC